MARIMAKAHNPVRRSRADSENLLAAGRHALVDSGKSRTAGLGFVDVSHSDEEVWAIPTDLMSQIGTAVRVSMVGNPPDRPGGPCPFR